MESQAQADIQTGTIPAPAQAARLRARLPRLGRPVLPRLRRPALPDLVLTLGTACLILTGLFLLAAPSIGRLRARAHEAAVMGNAATLQLAAESYAAAHLGRYPADGQDLLPYLPDGEAPRNPYSGAEATFRGGVGDLTYRSPTGGRDYVIQAWGPGGARPRLLVTLRGRAATAGF